MFKQLKGFLSKSKGDLKLALMAMAASKELTLSERLTRKFYATHELIGEVQPSRVITKSDGTKESVSMGHTRQVKNKDGEIETQLVVVPVFQYRGYDYKKRYTCADLRRIRRGQMLKAIEGHTHYTDGTPIIVGGE